MECLHQLSIPSFSKTGNITTHQITNSAVKGSFGEPGHSLWTKYEWQSYHSGQAHTHTHIYTWVTRLN